MVSEVYASAWERAQRRLSPSDGILSPYVDTPCLLWRGPTSRGDRGYARIGVGPILYKVHRLAWVVAHGEIPDGLYVLHRCDQPGCSNVEHLRLGTHSDNMADCSMKGRKRGGSFNRGSSNGRSRLSGDQVAAIREDIATGLTHTAIGARHGVARSHVTNIANGKRWRSV